MKPEDTNIFISYRRLDGRDLARTVQLALEKRGFRNVFFDYSSLREGTFNTQIFTAIDNCKDFLLVLSPHSMERCSNPDDWVATEITRAISAGCNIIPIAINEPFNNWPEDLPRQLNILKRQQMLTLRTDEYFESSVERLAGWLESKPLPLVKEDAAASAKCTLSIMVDDTCELFIDGEKIRKIKGGKTITLDDINRNRRYNIRLNSLARKGEYIEESYIFPEKSSGSDLLTFSFSEKREKMKEMEEVERKQKRAEKGEAYSKRGRLKQIAELYDRYDLYNEDMLAIEKSGKIGFLDESALEVIPCQYDDVSSFLHGYATVCKGGAWEIIDKAGERIMGFSSDTPCVIMPEGKYHVASRNGKYNVFPIHPAQKITEPSFIYDDILFIEDIDNMFFGKRGDIWKLETLDGSTPPWTMPVKSLESHLRLDPVFFNLKSRHRICRFPLRVENIDTGKFGYLNHDFRLTIPFVDGLSGEECVQWNLKIISTNDRMGLVDAESGKVILPPTYTFIRQINKHVDMPVALFMVGEGCTPKSFEISFGKLRINDWHWAYGGMQGIADEEGNFIVPQLYQMIESYVEDGFFVAYKLANCHANYDLNTTTTLQRTGKLKFDSTSSEIHVYADDGRLLLTGPYNSLKDTIRERLAEINYP